MTRAITAVIAALVLLAPATASAATPKRFFGVMADGPLESGVVPIASQAPLMKSSGVGSVRLAVYWSDLQPQQGQAPDFTWLDARIGPLAAQRIDVLPVVLRTPTWARQNPEAVGSPPRSNADYASFLTALVGRYGPAGSFWAENPGLPRVPVRRWQIWNEPELVKYFSPAKNQNGWARPYVSLLKAAHGAIRRADPGAKVVAAGLTGYTWADLRKIYAAGGRRYFDVAAIHPFSKRVENVLRHVRYTRSVMGKAGDSKKSLALTEVSWSSGQGRSSLNYGWETTEAGQASILRSALRQLAANRTRWRLAGLWWYTWMSRPAGSPESFDYAGLRRQSSAADDGSAAISKPALAAWQQVVKQLTR